MTDLFDDIEDDGVDDLELEFNLAADYLAKNVTDIDRDNLLQLYGLYKQATVGKCNISKPGMFSWQAKAKWTAWNDLNDMLKSDAMIKYIEQLEVIKPNWKDASSTMVGRGKPKDQQWISVSQLQSTDADATEIPDAEKTAFDFVKEGDLIRLQKELTSSTGSTLNAIDDSGLGLIHWAADRGNPNVLNALLTSNGCNVNLQDADGQTALHYAASVGHLECVKLLLDSGADRSIRSNDGELAIDVTDDENIVKLLDQH